MKLTPKIVGIVLLASIIPLVVLAELTLIGVAQFGGAAKEGVVNVSQNYLIRAGEEAVKMKTEELAEKVRLYLKQKLKENPNLTTSDLMIDPDFLEIASRKWGKDEYTWILAGAVVGGERRVVTIVYPTLPKDQLGKDIKYDLRWNEEMPAYYNLTTASMGSFVAPTCGYYKWVEPTTRERVEKYACQFPASLTLLVYDPTLKTKVFLIAGTAAYMDGYFEYLTKSRVNPAENIAGEVSKNVEKAGEQIYVNLIIAFVIALAFVAMIGYFTVKMVANPIVELSKTADRISAGEVDSEVPFKARSDEVGILANSVERLRRSLKVAMQSLEEALK
ncbi:MAG: HAMP domain-containing protein [Archaeoglobaceae archaeon]